MWWTRALVDEDEVDSATFPDRRRQAKAEEHQRVWSEAQRIFSEKAKAGGYKIPIDLGGGGGGGDGDGDGMEDDGSSGPSVRRADDEDGGEGDPADLAAMEARRREVQAAMMSPTMPPGFSYASTSASGGGGDDDEDMGVPVDPATLQPKKPPPRSCDTFAVLGDATADGSVLFGKNSE